MDVRAIDRKKLIPLIDRLLRSIEEFSVSGLTVASDSTRQTLGVAFQEASRMRLLRLGSTLRAANDELARYTSNDPDFSPKRLSFFLNRAWLLGQAIKRSIREDDEDELRRLLWSPTSSPVERLDVITVGVSKKVTSSFCGFEFRLRTVSDTESVPQGARLIWSVVFPVKKDSQVPPEGYLHLPQKQKFNASVFLDTKIITLESVAVSSDKHGTARIGLLPDSKVTTGDEFSNWSDYLTWEPRTTLEMIKAHNTTPLDLEIELQDEVAFSDFDLSEDDSKEVDGNNYYPLRCGALSLFVMIPGSHAEQEEGILKVLTNEKKVPSTLYGLMHFERCMFVIQPLTLFSDSGPRYLHISDEKIDKKALLQALKF